MNPNPILKKLGYADDDRLVIIHTDDIGMCQASVDAFADLWAFGGITSGAVMVPCPWFLEAAKFSRENPEADLGIHITLTSEWDTYRWRPISTADRATGLFDDEDSYYLIGAMSILGAIMGSQMGYHSNSFSTEWRWEDAKRQMDWRDEMRRKYQWEK